MKWIVITACSFMIMPLACSLPEDPFVTNHFSLDENLVHFDVYIELLPDTTLNTDEQSHQKYELRLLSRGGYDITIYKIDDSMYGESVVRRGVSNHVGNYKVLDIPPDTYHIKVTSPIGVIQQSVVTPITGKLTMLTFSFHIPAG